MSPEGWALLISAIIGPSGIGAAIIAWRGRGEPKDEKVTVDDVAASSSDAQAAYIMKRVVDLDEEAKASRKKAETTERVLNRTRADLDAAREKSSAQDQAIFELRELRSVDAHKIEGLELARADDSRRISFLQAGYHLLVSRARDLHDHWPQWRLSEEPPQPVDMIQQRPPHEENHP